MNIWKKFVVLVGLACAVSANAWEVRQVQVNHVQIGSPVNSNYFFMTIAGGDVIAASGCSNQGGDGKNWLGFNLTDMGEKGKAIISMAIAAQASGQKVDVGSHISGCNAVGLAHLDYIRIGDWQN